MTGCTCHDVPDRPDHVKLIISASGKPLMLNNLDQKLKDWRTLKQHYYPEGGWGWVVLLVAILTNLIAFGMQLCLAVLFINNLRLYSIRYYSRWTQFGTMNFTP